MKPKRILVPTDYSPCADRALELALQFADHYQAALDLVHAYQVPADVYPYSLYITDKHLKAFRERHEEQMKRLCEDTRQRGARVEGVVLQGETHDVIPNFAKAQKTDLIIMGTRGRGGLPHLLLGSTAERTVRLAACPVITVPPSPEA